MSTRLAPRPALSVVLPCHNELAGLPDTLGELEGVLGRLGPSIEIVVVDDGSEDGTADWLGQRRGAVPLSLVSHARRRGYGRAVRSGLEKARGERVAYLDGDGQYDPACLVEMSQLMDAGWDIVAGVRRKRRDPPHRLLIGASYNVLMRRVTRTPLRDVDCGCKLLNRRAVDRLQLVCDGNLLGAELMGKAHHQGLRIHQIPVTHRRRRHGRSKGADVFAAWNAARELYTHWSDLRPE